MLWISQQILNFTKQLCPKAFAKTPCKTTKPPLNSTNKENTATTRSRVFFIISAIFDLPVP
jgi:hypothetical protein